MASGIKETNAAMGVGVEAVEATPSRRLQLTSPPEQG